MLSPVARALSLLLLSTLLLSTLCGCGQMGPLYMPEEPAVQAPAPSLQPVHH